MTSLYSLARVKKWEEVKSILEKEPHRINEKGDWDGTLAVLAIQQGNLAILKYLADKGLNFKQLDNRGRSVLHEAACYKNIEIVKYVVEVQKLDLNHQTNGGNTALHWAAYNGCLENVKYLVAAGAALDLKNKKGKTADYAKQRGKQEVYEYLVAAAQQRSSKPATTTTTNSSSSALSEITAKTELLEAQLKEAIRRNEELTKEKQSRESSFQEAIKELTKEKKSLQNSYDALQANHEQTVSLLKEAQFQVAASKAHQLEYALATIPAQHLKIIKVLGKGATAEVSLVTWKSKQYAYKRFYDEETASTCIKEASVAMSLACPYIIHVYGKTEAPAGMLVEYMNKGSLFDLLFKTKISLTGVQKTQIALDVANALVLMHDRGILHRDIKPDNVMVHGSEDNSELYAKVADFGTAKLLSTRMTSATVGTSAFTGTLNFMAPELLTATIAQFQAEIMGDPIPSVSATKECDAYSLGVLLFELICEKQAYQGMFFASPIQFMKHVISGKRPEIPNTCPVAWKALIESCWKQDPKQRPTMKEIVTSLELQQATAGFGTASAVAPLQNMHRQAEQKENVTGE